jgi:hypothetical protein
VGRQPDHGARRARVTSEVPIARTRRWLNADLDGSERIRIIRTPVRAPRRTPSLSCFLGTIPRDYLDRMPILVANRGEYVLEDVASPLAMLISLLLICERPGTRGSVRCWLSWPLRPGRGGVSSGPSLPGRRSGCHRSSIPGGRRLPRLISVRGVGAPVTRWWVGAAPREGLPPLCLIGRDGIRAPAAVAAQEPAGNIENRRDGHTGGEVDQAAGARGSSPSSRSVWKQRRLSFRLTDRAARLPTGTTEQGGALYLLAKARRPGWEMLAWMGGLDNCAEHPPGTH